MLNSSIWPIGRTLSGATTPGQSWPGSDGNEVIIRIPKSSIISGDLPSDCVVSYSEHSLERGVLILCREAVAVFYNTSRLRSLCLYVREWLLLYVYIYMLCIVVLQKAFFCTRLYDIKNSNLIEIICKQIYLTQTGINTRNQCEPRSYGNERILYTLYIWFID